MWGEQLTQLLGPVCHGPTGPSMLASCLSNGYDALWPQAPSAEWALFAKLEEGKLNFWQSQVYLSMCDSQCMKHNSHYY